MIRTDRFRFTVKIISTCSGTHVSNLTVGSCPRFLPGMDGDGAKHKEPVGNVDIANLAHDRGHCFWIAELLRAVR